jgi:cation:H+ antiporter
VLDWLLLLVSLVIILAGAELFVNAVEWIGRLFNLSEGATGSILAAVGTALPETLIPILALVFGNADVGEEIGIGAILGAPLMLSTLAMFVSGVAVFAFRKRRKNGLKVVASYKTMSRDLSFFVLMYTMAILVGKVDIQVVKWGVAIFLVCGYAFYVRSTLRQQHDGEDEGDPERCYFCPRGGRPGKPIVFIQAAAALGLIVFGADEFVGSVTSIATHYGIPAFVLAIIITPIATELPEKFNSCIWISRGKDTLALGNITGAMVFQSTLIPAIGIVLTDWQLTSGALLSGVLALASAGVLLLELVLSRHIRAHFLLLAGCFYAMFILSVVLGWIR